MCILFSVSSVSPKKYSSTHLWRIKFKFYHVSIKGESKINVDSKISVPQRIRICLLKICIFIMERSLAPKYYICVAVYFQYLSHNFLFFSLFSLFYLEKVLCQECDASKILLYIPFIQWLCSKFYKASVFSVNSHAFHNLSTNQENYTDIFSIFISFDFSWLCSIEMLLWKHSNSGLYISFFNILLSLQHAAPWSVISSNI